MVLNELNIRKNDFALAAKLKVKKCYKFLFSLEVAMSRFARERERESEERQPRKRNCLE
jgi:hypothetical protein